jgi:hypothetical protein
MASLRNIAAALRYDARDATRLLPLLGITGSRPALGQVVEACTTVALGAPG